MYDFFSIISSTSTNIPQNIVQSRQEFMIYLTVIQVLISTLLFLVFIFITNKVAGPLHKLKIHLQKIREGGEIEPVNFRTGDYFHDLAYDVNLFLETILKNQEKDFEYLDEVSTYVENLSLVIPNDKKPVLNEISRKLNDIKSRYEKKIDDLE